MVTCWLFVPKLPGSIPTVYWFFFFLLSQSALNATAAIVALYKCQLWNPAENLYICCCCISICLYCYLPNFFLGISKEEAMSYRLHTFEVLEFSPDVSFIIMMPPREQLCSVQISEPQAPASAGCKTNLFYIPMKIFETSKLAPCWLFRLFLIGRTCRSTTIRAYDWIRNGTNRGSMALQPMWVKE